MHDTTSKKNRKRGWAKLVEMCCRVPTPRYIACLVGSALTDEQPSTKICCRWIRLLRDSGEVAFDVPIGGTLRLRRRGFRRSEQVAGDDPHRPVDGRSTDKTQLPYSGLGDNRLTLSIRLTMRSLANQRRGHTEDSVQVFAIMRIDPDRAEDRPARKVSMMIRRPPQRGHRHGKTRGSSGALRLIGFVLAKVAERNATFFTARG
jgi:hypothetical protein